MLKDFTIENEISSSVNIEIVSPIDITELVLSCTYQQTGFLPGVTCSKLKM